MEEDKTVIRSNRIKRFHIDSDGTGWKKSQYEKSLCVNGTL